MAEQLQSFLRLKQVKILTGLSRSWIYEAIRRGDFLAPISIGARAVAWSENSIAKWQTHRIEKSRNAVSLATKKGGTK